MNENKSLKLKIILVTVSCLAAVSFPLGFYAGSHTEAAQIKIFSNLINTTSEDSQTDFNLFWDAWKLLRENYLRSDQVSDQKMVYGAIRGLAEGMGDKYTTYFDPEEAKQFSETINGEFGGIGAELESQNGYVIVVAPLKGTPAEAVGMKAKDVIVKIDGKDVTGENLNDVVKNIRGEAGSKVKITVLREGVGSLDFNITRAIIKVPAIKYETKGNIGYIKIASFTPKTSEEFAKAISDLFGNKKVSGLVIDLRNNPGGYLDTAVKLAGWFLPKNSLVVSERYSSGNSIELRSDGMGVLKNVPTVVLVNNGSASASEILAGALHDINGTKLIGEKTFGKGTVQELKELSDGSMLKITIANWVTPGGVIIDKEGIKPDVETKNPESKDNKTEPKDLQLEKAVEIVKGMIK